MAERMEAVEDCREARNRTGPAREGVIRAVQAPDQPGCSLRGRIGGRTQGAGPPMRSVRSAAAFLTSLLSREISGSVKRTVGPETDMPATVSP